MRLIVIFLLISIVSAADKSSTNFSIDQFDPFLPGKIIKREELKAEVIKDQGEIKSLLYHLKNEKYRIPLHMQTKGEKVVDLYMRLPAYFLHDVFLQSLINRYGKPDQFHSVNKSSIYIWKNKSGLNHTYQGSCSITCFPIFYSVSPEPKESGVTPLLETLSEEIKSP